MVVLTPLLVVFVLVTVAFGRWEMMREDVTASARAGVEAASVATGPATAPSAAEGSAGPAMSPVRRLCSSMKTETGTSDFVPGGQVSVNVTCEVRLSDLGAPGVPGSVSVSVTEVAPVDPFRAVS